MRDTVTSTTSSSISFLTDNLRSEPRYFTVRCACRHLLRKALQRLRTLATCCLDFTNPGAQSLGTGCRALCTRILMHTVHHPPANGILARPGHALHAIDTEHVSPDHTQVLGKLSTQERHTCESLPLDCKISSIHSSVKVLCSALQVTWCWNSSSRPHAHIFFLFKINKLNSDFFKSS